MLHLMKNEWKKIWLSVLLAVLTVTIAASVLTATRYHAYSLTYTLDAWEIGTELFGILYPLLVVIPLCWNLYQERKNNFLLYVQPRVSMARYLSAKWIVYAISAFCMITIPYLVSAATVLLIQPPLSTLNLENATHIFKTAYTRYPVVYAVSLSSWKGFLGILVMTMGFVLAMYCDNVFVVLTGPFLYATLENFILAILGIPEYRLVTAFEPSCLDPEVVSMRSFVVGPVLLIACTILLAFFFSKIQKAKVVKI